MPACHVSLGHIGFRRSPASSPRGGRAIRRPDSLSDDLASSESAWLHAVDEIKKQGIEMGWIVGMQATSPIREPRDIEQALQRVQEEKLDSLFAAIEVEDFNI
jgi:CMP-N,N'-diacetyllegionaminic acid synthase